MASRWSGGVAAISGAGSGIGAGLARHAASVGMSVAVMDVSADRADETAARIRKDGGSATALAVDVRDAAAVAEAAQRVTSDLGPVSFLGCNAGIEHTGRVWDTDPEHWRRVQDINVNGAFNMVRAFVPAMVKRQDGPRHVLFTSSIGGIAVSGQQAAYTVSKHAIRVLGQCLAADLADVGSDVEVSVLLPGAVRTAIFEDAQSAGDEAAEGFRQQLAAMLDQTGLTPDEVAALVFEQIDAGRRWIYPHPEMARDVLTHHVQELLDSLPKV